MKEPKSHNGWAIYGKKKSARFEQNWGLFLQKWYTDRWVEKHLIFIKNDYKMVMYNQDPWYNLIQFTCWYVCPCMYDIDM